jgi:cholesterol oxidase
MSTYDFDAIVIGSGFGGSVMTYRLAEAGLRVCLLERGKEYPPGTFPRSPWRMKTNFWDPSEGLQGMFNIWSFDDIGGVVSSGLGGGSLIYANVLYRKPEETFAREGWPITYTDLEPHYAAAERMLNGQRYPFQREGEPKDDDHAPYNRTSKTRAMEIAAKAIAPQNPGLKHEFPLLAVTFANPGEPPRLAEPIEGAPPSMFGRTRLTCQLCGECDIGCNYGSKNTLDLTYLSAALQLPTPPEIRTRSEAREFEPYDGGYRVRYVVHNDEDEGRKRAIRSADMPMTEITSRFLVLSAGSFGSTFLLLKNAEKFPNFSREALGTRFCGNGDLLTVLYRSHEAAEKGAKPRVLDPGYGPVITSAIRFTEKDPATGQPRGYYYVEDAGYPEFANWLIEATDLFSLLKRVTQLARSLVPRWLKRKAGEETDISQEIAALLGDCRLSSTSMPLLSMGRDTPDGVMSLTPKGRLAVDWSVESSAPYFANVRKSARQIATALHARFQDNPLTHLSRVITVHPLGGCPMGRTPEEGVVDTHGQVFGHPGFYIADGSVIPGPIGPNPSLTIAACAGRFADHLIGEAIREIPTHTESVRNPD